MTSIQLKYKTIRTFDSWLDLAKDQKEEGLLANPVVKMGFSELGEVELFEVSGSLICNVIRLSAFSQAGALGDFIHSCFPKCQDMLEEEFIDEVDNYVMIFCDYGDFLLKEFVGGNSAAAQQAYLLLFQNMLNIL